VKLVASNKKSVTSNLGAIVSIASLRRGVARIALLLGLVGSSATAHAQTDPEFEAWARANTINTADAYQKYLSEFPLGKHSQDAFAQLIRLTQFTPTYSEPINQNVRVDDPDTPGNPY
jgi:hypothetical protein